ncbi:MAG TPA: hypothetical protein VGR80_14310 [Steroidobacteraceae bacterium]|nr:hypothetical protein [Steroidobacteraceae bacterium]
MRKEILPAMLGALLVVSSIAGCGRASNWQQTYEGCKRLAAAMTQDPSGLLKAPDCERIPQLCSADANSAECRNELAGYSTK